MDILETIVAQKRREVARQKEAVPLDMLFRMESQRLSRSVFSMRQSLERSSSGIIAEFKRRSPSKGWLSPQAKVEDVVPVYERNGAAACSILTDNRFFGGSFTDLQCARSLVRLPLLRKDFMLDEYQIYQSRVMGADVILLIASILTKELCKKLAKIAHQLKMEVLLEVHNEHELSFYNENIDMLGVNNRNLGTFHTDIINSYRMIELIKSEIGAGIDAPLLVSESGISDLEDINKLRDVGFRGFLIGEMFMKNRQSAPEDSPRDEKFNFQFSPESISGFNYQFKIKVCGMRDPVNINDIEGLDVDSLGFIFYSRSPRYVPETSANIEAISNCKKNKVGVFVNETLETMLQKAKLFRLQFLQLHGNETADLCRELRQLGYFVIKTFSIATANDFQQTEHYRDCCDYFLFDTKSADYGGAGKRFDWSLIKIYQDKTPFLLSGGLTPDCASDIKQLNHPQFAGIDLNSGFEIFPAMKDVGKLNDFINEIRQQV